MTAAYFTSLNQRTGDAATVAFDGLRVLKNFARAEFGSETLYVAQRHTAEMNRNA